MESLNTVSYSKVDPEEVIKLLQEILKKLNLKRRLLNEKNISNTFENRI